MYKITTVCKYFTTLITPFFTKLFSSVTKSPVPCQNFSIVLFYSTVPLLPAALFEAFWFSLQLSSENLFYEIKINVSLDSKIREKCPSAKWLFYFFRFEKYALHHHHQYCTAGRSKFLLYRQLQRLLIALLIPLELKRITFIALPRINPTARIVVMPKLKT